MRTQKTDLVLIRFTSPVMYANSRAHLLSCMIRTSYRPRTEGSATGIWLNDRIQSGNYSTRLRQPSTAWSLLIHHPFSRPFRRSRKQVCRSLLNDNLQAPPRWSDPEPDFWIVVRRRAAFATLVSLELFLLLVQTQKATRSKAREQSAAARGRSCIRLQ
jgi:hypothetical protein